MALITLQLTISVTRATCTIQYTGVRSYPWKAVEAMYIHTTTIYTAVAMSAVTWSAI